MKVNQNISAVITNNHLLRTESNLSASIERLSSGLRINNAKDDPAGLAISNKMRQQIDGIEQANKNAQDAISVLNTADGALNEVTSIIQRMHELAVQAANDTNTLEDREATQLEIDALIKEVDRISKDTEYNTKTLLDGSLDTRVYEKNVDRISVSDYVESGRYKVNVTSVATQAEFTANGLVSVFENLGDDFSADLNVNGFKVRIEATDDEETIKEKIRTAAEKGEAIAEIDAAGNVEFTSALYGSDGVLDISYTLIDNSNDGAETVNGITAAPIYGENAELTLVFKNANGTTGSNFEETATVTAEGNKVTITDKGGFSMSFLMDVDKVKNGDQLDFEVTEIGTMNIQVGANEHQMVNVRIPEISAKSLYLDTVDLTTIHGADRAMDTLDEALATVSAVRSKIGAYSNRMEHASGSLGQTEEDLTAAFSSIKDIDMASEMTQYANQQVLQQAATSVLSQANDLPQQVLQLLQ